MKTRPFKFVALAFLLAASIALPVCAQQPRPASATKHSLWKVDGKRNTVYLLGSIHFLKKEDYPLAAPIEAAFTNAEIAVFETDYAEMEQPEAQVKLMSKGRLPEGETLQDRLSADTYKKLSAQVEESGLPMMIFEQLKPSLAAMMLTVLELQKLEFDPQYGVDKHFYDLARKAGKQIVPLETVDFQIGLVTDFTKAEDELVVTTTLKDLSKVKKEFADIIKAWRSGDDEKLAKLLNEAMSESPAIFKRLLTDRNQRWLPKIEELLSGEKNAIIIVGAGHLVGKDGVVNLLKKKNFKVTQQ